LINTYTGFKTGTIRACIIASSLKQGCKKQANHQAIGKKRL
jgi:hypothetical protein